MSTAETPTKPLAERLRDAVNDYGQACRAHDHDAADRAGVITWRRNAADTLHQLIAEVEALTNGGAK